MEALIRKSKVIVCAGSGGVGKTTVSASLGVLAAQIGLRVLVLTIDPAKRLATSLGIESDFLGDVKVPNQNYPGELYAALVHSEEIFEGFIRETLQNKDDVERLLANRLYRQLATTLSGSQEFTSLEKLLTSVESTKFDLVILDTPPAQHAVDFLSAPEKIYALFQESVTKWFISSNSEKTTFVHKILERGTKTVMGALEKITGSNFVIELGVFFECVWGLQKRIRQRSREVKDLLGSTETNFILVTGFDESKLSEGKTFSQDLQADGYTLGAVVLNRAFPTWLNEDVEELSSDDASPRVKKLKELYNNLRSYHVKRHETYDQFAAQIGSQVPVAWIPDMDIDIYGLDGLELLAKEINNRLR